MGCGSSKKDDIIVPSKGDKKATTSEVMSNSTNKPQVVFVLVRYII